MLLEKIQTQKPEADQEPPADWRDEWPTLPTNQCCQHPCCLPLLLSLLLLLHAFLPFAWLPLATTCGCCGCCGPVLLPCCGDQSVCQILIVPSSEPDAYSLPSGPNLHKRKVNRHQHKGKVTHRHSAVGSTSHIQQTPVLKSSGTEMSFQSFQTSNSADWQSPTSSIPKCGCAQRLNQLRAQAQHGTPLENAI